MMGKIMIQDIAKILVERNGLSKKEASAFANAMFDIIQQALERDKIVKVKGLGTFKIIDVDARESVNVNTGERVLIEGHNKITFTPDSLMKELVNKPFSQFETVVLKDGVDFEDMDDDKSLEESNSDSGDPSSMPLVDFGESDNLNSAVSDGENQDAKPEAVPEPEIVLVSDPEPEPEIVPEPEQAPKPEIVPETEEEPEQVLADEESVDEEPLYEDEKSPSSVKTWLVTLIASVIGLLIGYVIGNYFPFANVDNLNLQKVEKATSVAIPESSKATKEKQDTLKQDTLKQFEVIKAEENSKTEGISKDSTASQPAAKASTAQWEVDPSKYDAMDARVRTGAYYIVGTANVVKANEGETLGRVSRRNLGPDMECYVEVYNGMKASDVLKAGQEIKIPKLQLKKKMKSQTVNK